MLAAGGGVFMTALNAREGWRSIAESIKTDRAYDAEFLLDEPVATERIAAALAAVRDIAKWEVWGRSEAALIEHGQDAVMRTYPDRGHGSFSLFGVPSQTEMIRFPLLEGRWLAQDDTDAIVVGQKTLMAIPGVKTGDPIRLSMDGRPTSWRLVGVVREIGGGGGYVTSPGYTRATSQEGTGGDIRLVVSGRTAEARERAIHAAEQALNEAGIGIARAMPLDRLYAAMVGHIEVPARMLIAGSLILVLLGGIGIGSMMTINVLERTREIAVMKALGAAPGIVVSMIAIEGLFVGGLSWMLAVLISLPLTGAISAMGRSAHGAPLPFTISTSAGAIWLGLVLVIALAASTAPALRAAHLVVREALAYE